MLVLRGFISLAVGDKCKPGLDYCGWNLLKRGNYYHQIANELKNKSQPLDDAHVNSGHFRCKGGQDGNIELRSFCGGDECQDGGTDRSDHCAVVSTTGMGVEKGTTLDPSRTSTLSRLSSRPSTSATLKNTVTSQSPRPLSQPVSHHNAIALAVGVSISVSLFAIILITIGVVHVRPKRARGVIETTDGRARVVGRKAAIDSEQAMAELEGRDLTKREERRSDAVHGLGEGEKRAELK